MSQHPGRMIRKTISLSEKVSSLSPHSLSLFCLLIPHFNSHGKMNGNPYFIKGEVVPLIEWFDINKIEKCLIEITQKTNVKCFKVGNLTYLHSLSWNDHQNLIRKRGPDLLPDYSCTNTVVEPPEVEGKGKEEGKGEGEGQNGTGPAKPNHAKLTDEKWIETLKENPAYKGIDIEKVRGKLVAWCGIKNLKPTRKRLLNWLNREDRPMESGKTEEEKIQEWANES